MHQFRDLHRLAGPRTTLDKARRNLEPYAPTACGLDIQNLLAAVGGWQQWLEASEGAQPPWPAIRVMDWEAVR